ncbi:hypothetical protein [Aeromicrobium sp. CnD17-E]|uniref:hypothetical protein n=1 Tax=Aeromicrobium sp. CnD17-E TaxID=2954487 RepID=UPI0020982D02|nr:hypothetical protein [Aeromicrobium sp. CnD17-E]MCO7237925.1 hypothetical protein [Aeromicrobium sp. CnD17-E]
MTKQDVLWEICEALDLPKMSVGVGSSLPSEVFDAAARQFGLPSGSMPEVGESVARKAGLSWPADVDSRGSVSGGGFTGTLEGLKIMRDALRLLLG